MDEKQAFIDLVTKGGEVSENTLHKNVPEAKRLTFLYAGNDLLGVAALKAPVISYRQKIRKASGVTVDRDQFPYELGYIYVEGAARGNGYSGILVLNALDATSRGVFATSRADNEPMHKTLQKHGFKIAGETYAGRNSGEMIRLFLKPPTD